MAIEHKAFLFQYDRFQEELAQLLENALKTETIAPIRMFIQLYHASMIDQWSEDHLSEDWEDSIEDRSDVQLYADIALTRYYNPTDSVGFGYSFEALWSYLQMVPNLTKYAEMLICGKAFGPNKNRLDPGRMGTGLLSVEEASMLNTRLMQTEWPTIPEPQSAIFSKCHYRPKSSEEIQQSRNDLTQLYQRAAENAVGILFVDFQD